MHLYSLGGFLVGILTGTILAVWGTKKNQKDLAVIGFCCCVFFGSIGGLIFAIPIVAIFLWLIKRADNNSKQVSMNESNITGNDKFYDEVARELQEKPMVPGLWTKAFAEMGGDDAKARALYIKYRVAQLAEAGQQQLEENRLAKQQQERPKRAKKTKLIFAVAILTTIFVVIVVQITAESGGFGLISSKKILAIEGDADAADSLGYFYYCGEGVAKDYTEAFKWFRKSADQNNPEAQEMLGECYHYGQGVQKDEVESAKWYRKSAEQGYSMAQWDLGYCYEQGYGVQQDEIEAYKWYSIAAAKGFEDAKTNLARVESQMTPEQIAKAQKLSAVFVPQKEKSGQ
jgi:TPR repeat protein